MLSYHMMHTALARHTAINTGCGGAGRASLQAALAMPLLEWFPAVQNHRLLTSGRLCLQALASAA